jgi:hypothetical protein
VRAPARTFVHKLTFKLVNIFYGWPQSCGSETRMTPQNAFTHFFFLIFGINNWYISLSFRFRLVLQKSRGRWGIDTNFPSVYHFQISASSTGRFVSNAREETALS